MKIIIAEKILEPCSQHSGCNEHSSILYLEGQLPFNPANKKIPDGIKAQTFQILQNTELILKEPGSKKENILRMKIFIPEIKSIGGSGYNLY